MWPRLCSRCPLTGNSQKKKTKLKIDFPRFEMVVSHIYPLVFVDVVFFVDVVVTTKNVPLFDSY
jgi:hypothetical protein